MTETERKKTIDHILKKHPDNIELIGFALSLATRPEDVARCYKVAIEKRMENKP